MKNYLLAIDFLGAIIAGLLLLSPEGVTIGSVLICIFLWGAVDLVIGIIGVLVLYYFDKYSR